MPDLREHLQRILGAAYTIERELVGGGMSRVFVAEDVRLGRRVVVKVLSPELGAGVSGERFEREIKLAARLQHPHIVPLLAAGDVDGLPFYTMPFVSGASLRERLQAGPLGAGEAQGILRDVAKALSYAHKQGIVHRDIKPENVLLSEGTAMVADFGVARAISAAATLAGQAMITQTGMAVGTPAYMAPEQAAGDPDVDFRADLYAFGVMAYELLAGQHPFAERKTAHALVTAHLTEQPRPIGTHTTNITPSLATIVMQCLGKDPMERPESASAVVAALEGASGGAIALHAPRDVALATPASSASAERGVPAASDTATVAVLPFANMSGDPDNEYFSDGLTDDIITALTQVSGLKVAARTSAFSFKGKNADLSVIGTALGVRTVLQGSVRRAGNRVRVTTQLMSTNDGYQLWSARYDRDLDDIFAIQDEIARGIVEQLRLTLGLTHETAQLVARPTDDLVAYELYLRGREALQQRTPPSIRRGLDFFLQAVARDPKYARAHLGVAEAYIGLGVYGAIAPDEAREKTDAAIAAAVAINPDLPAVHLLRAQLKLYLRSDWPTAGEDLARAIERDPDDALANVYMGYYHSLLGNREERTKWTTRGVDCDPLSPFVRGIAGMSYYYTGDYFEALRLYDEGLALDPNTAVCLWQSGLTFMRVDRVDDALARYTRAVDLSQRGTLMLAFQHNALVRLGRMDEAVAIVAEIRERERGASQHLGVGHWLIIVLAGANEDEVERALKLQLAAGTGPTTMALSVDKELEALLTHSRFGPLVRQLSLYARNPKFQPGKDV